MERREGALIPGDPFCKIFHNRAVVLNSSHQIARLVDHLPHTSSGAVIDILTVLTCTLDEIFRAPAADSMHRVFIVSYPIGFGLVFPIDQLRQRPINILWPKLRKIAAGYISVRGDMRAGSARTARNSCGLIEIHNAHRIIPDALGCRVFMSVIEAFSKLESIPMIGSRTAPFLRRKHRKDIDVFYTDALEIVHDGPLAIYHFRHQRHPDSNRQRLGTL